MQLVNGYFWRSVCGVGCCVCVWGEVCVSECVCVSVCSMEGVCIYFPMFHYQIIIIAYYYNSTNCPSEQPPTPSLITLFISGI